MFLLLWILFLIGLFSGAITGLLSVGGGIILVACLLMIPPLLHFKLSLQMIASFAMIQALFATISGALYYFKSKLIDKTIILYLGLPSMFGGAIGSYFSYFFSESTLKVVFAIMATLASIAMFFPVNNLVQMSETPKVSKLLVASIGVLIGAIGGLIGVTGGFIFVPVILFVFKFPLRKAIGSSLVTCFLVAVGGFMVKLGMQSVPFQSVVVLVGGGVIGAQLGGRLNKYMKASFLKKLVAATLVVISIKTFVEVFYLSR